MNIESTVEAELKEALEKDDVQAYTRPGVVQEGIHLFRSVQ